MAVCCAEEKNYKKLWKERKIFAVVLVKKTVAELTKKIDELGKRKEKELKLC